VHVQVAVHHSIIKPCDLSEVARFSFLRRNLHLQSSTNDIHQIATIAQ
jgi:hypothetical protein